VSVDKDVDCFHPENVGLVLIGAPRFAPATPAGVIELLGSPGHPVAVHADEPSGQHVYITRLPYDCQTKLPETSDAD